MRLRSHKHAVTKTHLATDSVTANRGCRNQQRAKNRQQKSTASYRITAFLCRVFLTPLFLYLTTSPVYADAQTQAQANTGTGTKIQFNIPRQRADDALTALGQQADLTVIYQYDLVKQHTTNQLRGDYTTTHCGSYSPRQRRPYRRV